MNNVTLIGIDVGAKGAICVLEDNKVTVHKIPETPTDLADLLCGIRDHAMINGCSVTCYMEKVGGYVGGSGCPGSAMFNFGQGYGRLEGVLATARIRWENPRAQDWQKALNLGTTGKIKARTLQQLGIFRQPDEALDVWEKRAAAARLAEKRYSYQYNTKAKTAWKNKLKAVAQRLYPSLNVTLANCDALLLLELARRRELGQMTPIVTPPITEATEAQTNLNV